jgi:glucan phosphoethanolaminetransferase (alkaline phosphatase superfamily)
MLRSLSVILYFYSLALCINSTLMFRSYIDNVDEEDIQKFPSYINLKYWKVYEMLGWVFSIILCILIVVAAERFIAKLNI